MSQHNKDISLSKSLSWLLRHGAVKEGLTISSDGFVSVSDILNHENFKAKYDLNDIKHIVNTNNKQRFALRTNSNVLEIKANQGHSLNVVDNLHLTPILNANDFDQVIHGTYFKCLPKIKEIGLSRMNRNHIHFTFKPLSNRKVSGIRGDIEVCIYIDLKKALKDGLMFYISDNDVILSPGNESGILETKYFMKICKVDGTLI